MLPLRLLLEAAVKVRKTAAAAARARLRFGGRRASPEQVEKEVTSSRQQLSLWQQHDIWLIEGEASAGDGACN